MGIPRRHPHRAPHEDPGGGPRRLRGDRPRVRAGEIEAAPLIIHGLADTNVHLLNSANFAQAPEHADKPFLLIPPPNEDRHESDGLATALPARVACFAQPIGRP